ncbi:MAG: TonB C-terminal domain-containing protein [Gallionella sp.]|nr:TonB C-terminal domain-containing protein [Gallionella sp.]
MSAVAPRDPDKLAAGMLALFVHVAFFALLYFGFSWQTEQVAVMSVELWQSLPEAAPERPVAARVREVVPPPPVQEEAVIKPEIVMPDKTPEKKPEKKPEPVRPPEKVVPEAKKPVETKKVAPKAAQPSAAEQQAARDLAAQVAATGRVVDEFIGKIQGKIRRNVIMPPGVADDARAEFLVTLLPGGRVLSVKLGRSSGNAAYDDAVERAILRSDPLPLPADPGLFNRFRDLKLAFKPVE